MLNKWFPPQGMTLPRLIKKIAVNQAVISPRYLLPTLLHCARTCSSPTSFDLSPSKRSFNGLFFGYAIVTRSRGKSWDEMWAMYVAKVRAVIGQRAYWYKWYG